MFKAERGIGIPIPEVSEPLPTTESETEEEAKPYERLDDAVADLMMQQKNFTKDKLKQIAQEFLSRDKKMLEDYNSQFSCEEMVGDLARLLVELESELVNYDTIISDDASGRMPSLFLRKIINQKRKSAGLSGIKTYFIAAGRSTMTPAEKEEVMNFFKKKGEEIGKALLVTEYIYSGQSIERLVQLLETVGIDFDLATISIQDDYFKDPSIRGQNQDQDFPKHLRYGGKGSDGQYFHGHFGSGVIRDKKNPNIHPIKNPDSTPTDIKSGHENINYLADQLYPLVE